MTPHRLPRHANSSFQVREGKAINCALTRRRTAPLIAGEAHRVGALVLKGGLGQHDDSALLHDGLKLVHALVEAAAANLPALSVQQLKGEQLACAGRIASSSVTMSAG